MFNLKHNYCHFYVNIIIIITVFQCVYVVVQFYPWFQFYFSLFLTHYHTSTYPKTKGNKIEPQHNILLSYSRGGAIFQGEHSLEYVCFI